MQREEEIKEKLQHRGLKITPQRVAVLHAIYTLNNHPTAQHIIDFVHKKYSNVATGTIYKTLDTLVEKGVIVRVRTTDEAARYDGRIDNHHHLYTEGSNHIEDYVNENLDTMLKAFFKDNRIPGYEISSIKVHINGKYEEERETG